MLKGKKIKLRAYKESEAELVWNLIEEESLLILMKKILELCLTEV